MSTEKQTNKVELKIPEDADRKDRTMEMMENESLIYKGFSGTEANFYYCFVKSRFVCEASSPSICTVIEYIEYVCIICS